MFDTTEVILNRIVIFVSKPMDIEPRYRAMFHGATHLAPGRYYYCYPCTNIARSRMVNCFHKRYKRVVKYTLAFGGLKEM